MFSKQFVATATLAAFLAAVSAPATAQTSAPQPSPLKASIDRAASNAAASPTLPQRRTAQVRKAQMQGGGGGGGKMVFTLIGTAVGLATTYFVYKEMKKQTEALTTPVQ
jgi:hypothetical protein